MPMHRICNYPGCITLTADATAAPNTLSATAAPPKPGSASATTTSAAPADAANSISKAASSTRNTPRIGKGDHVLEHHLYRAACPHCHQQLHTATATIS